MKRSRLRTAAATLALLVTLPAAAAEPPRLEMDLDPRLELLYALHTLGQPDGPQAVPAPLLKLRDHEAVRLDASMDPFAFNTRTRYESLVRRDLASWEEPAAKVSSRFTEAAGGTERWERWTSALDRFAKEPGFQRYLEGRRKESAPFLATARPALKEIGFVERIELYTGLPFHGRHLIVPSPFTGKDSGGAFGLVVRKTDGTYYLVNGVDPSRFNVRQAGPYIWHEEAHAIMDTLADLFKEEVARSAGLLEKLGDCRGQWLQCVKEHINDAVADRLVMREFGEKDEVYYGQFIASRHPYVPGLLAQLKTYEASKAPLDMAAFYPTLLEAFPPAPLPPAKPQSGAGPNLLETVTFPYWTEGERVRALAVIERTLPSSRGPARYTQSAVFNKILGRDERAVKDAGTALERRADDAMALVTRAAALLSLNRSDAAVKDIEAAQRSCAKDASQPACGMSWPTGSPGPNPVSNRP